MFQSVDNNGLNVIGAGEHALYNFIGEADHILVHKDAWLELQNTSKPHNQIIGKLSATTPLLGHCIHVNQNIVALNKPVSSTIKYTNVLPDSRSFRPYEL